MKITIARFLQKMVGEEGTSCLKDGIRINGYLADYFPEAKRERSVIRSAIEIGCVSGFCDLAKEKDEILREMRIRQMKNQLLTEAWLSDEAANYVIVTFSKAVSLPLKEICRYIRMDDAGKTVISEKTEQILFSAGPEYVYRYGMELMKAAGDQQQDYINELFQWAASKEYAPAQMELGRLYEKKKDMPRAFVWYQRAAGNRDVEGAFRLSQLYRLAGDEKNAALWCETAARAGHAKAQLSYGIMHQYGIGVPGNQQLALQWYRRSADQGDKEAKMRHRDLVKELQLDFRS